jgi:hypothetical protein
MAVSKEQALAALKATRKNMEAEGKAMGSLATKKAPKQSWWEKLKSGVQYELALRRNQRKMKDRARAKSITTTRTKAINKATGRAVTQDNKR